MKRFWWNSKLSKIFWDYGIGEVLRSDESGLFDTDYLGSSPREIQSAEYNPETGRIKLVPKEPVTPRKVMVEVELPPKGSTDVLIYSFCQDGSYAHVTATEESDLHKAFYELDGVEQDGVVSKQQPSNPYTREAIKTPYWIRHNGGTLFEISHNPRTPVIDSYLSEDLIHSEKFDTWLRIKEIRIRYGFIEIVSDSVKAGA